MKITNITEYYSYFNLDTIVTVSACSTVVIVVYFMLHSYYSNNSGSIGESLNNTGESENSLILFSELPLNNTEESLDDSIDVLRYENCLYNPFSYYDIILEFILNDTVLLTAYLI